MRRRVVDQIYPEKRNELVEKEMIIRVMSGENPKLIHSLLVLAMFVSVCWRRLRCISKQSIHQQTCPLQVQIAGLTFHQIAC